MTVEERLTARIRPAVALLAALFLGFVAATWTAGAQSDLEPRVAALEQKTQDLNRYTFHDSNIGVDIPALQINARVGLSTNYWMNKPLGEGAALSIGAEDRFALYAEIDNNGFTYPSIAIYGAAVSPNGVEPNVGLAAIAANSVINYNIISGNNLALRPEGIHVLDGKPLFIGLPTNAKQLWP